MKHFDKYDLHTEYRPTAVQGMYYIKTLSFDGSNMPQFVRSIFFLASFYNHILSTLLINNRICLRLF